MPKLIAPEKLKDLAAKDPLAHVYTLTWGRHKTKIEGCLCGLCQETQPAGTRIWGLRSSYHGIRMAVCM